MAGRWRLGIAFVAVFTTGVGVASLATARSTHRVIAHAARTHEAMHATAAAAPSTKVRRIETSPFTLQPGEVGGASGTCAAKTPHPVSGYWGTDDEGRGGDLVVVRSTPVGGSGRQWEVGVKNVGATPLTAYVGTVCIR